MKQRLFFATLAKKMGFDPVVDFHRWYNISQKDICEHKVTKITTKITTKATISVTTITAITITTITIITTMIIQQQQPNQQQYREGGVS